MQTCRNSAILDSPDVFPGTLNRTNSFTFFFFIKIFFLCGFNQSNSLPKASYDNQTHN